MAFNTKELEIIKYGVQNGKSRAEVEDALTRLRTGQGAKKAIVPEPVAPTYGEQVSEVAKAGVAKIGEGIATSETQPSLVESAERGLKIGAGAIETAMSPLAPLFSPIGKLIGYVTNKLSETPLIKGAVGAVESVGADGKPVFSPSPNQEPILAERVLEDVANASTIAGTVAGGLATPKVASGVKTGITETATKFGTAVRPVTQGVSNVAEMTVGGVSRIPGRIATNIAEKQAIEAAIVKLPTKIAQKAARDGIDVADVKTIYQTPIKVKPRAKELVDTVIKFAKKETDIEPIEVVGKPIVAKMKELESLKGSVGQKLGEEAKKLGVVTKEEVTQPVFDSLRKVRGLDGLTVDKNGVLNFKNTVLTTVETAADRKAIQSIYTQATKWGNGEAKHRLRQELFEILGGKKKAGVLLTETQDSAYQAIRQGLANVLDKKNPVYKDLNMQFAKLSQPISDLRKAMQAVPGATEDILDMSAGLLARRLTSTSLSQGKIRAILDAMDNVTKVKGNLRETVESTQKLYNILSKYYDLAPSTGFQGQIKAGIEGARGLTDAVVGAVRDVAGETAAVRQKAIESAIREAFGG